MESVFEVPWDQLTLEDIQGFLAGAGDEGLRWEAKGTSRPRPDAVAKAVGGFANRDGGYVIIGAERRDGGWHLEGVSFDHAEPATWLTSVLASSLRPTPEVKVRVWEVSDGRTVAVLAVPPNAGALSVTRQGVVYRRLHGQTMPVTDGSELSRLQANTVDLQVPGKLSTELPSADFVTAAESLCEHSRAAPIRTWIGAVPNEALAAAMAGDDARLGLVLDRLTDSAAILLQRQEEGALAGRALRAFHRIFDGAARLHPSPAGVAEMVWRELLIRARALGALAVRLEQWSAARILVLHEVDVEGSRVWPSWLRYADIGISRARAWQPQQANRLEKPLLMSAEATMRLLPLHDDIGLDTESALDSITQFDLLANLIESWEAAGANGVDQRVYPRFAEHDDSRSAPMARLLIRDSDVRRALLGAIDEGELATLLRFVGCRAQRAAESSGTFDSYSGFEQQCLVAQFIATRSQADSP